MLKTTKNKKLQQLSVSLLAAVFVFAPLQSGNFFNASVVKAENVDSELDYIDSNGYEWIENGDVTWGPGDHIIERGVFIDGGSTLTIEKGARIIFKKTYNDDPYFEVDNGRVIALGTQDEKITFSAADELSKNFYVMFYGSPTSETSFFRYVDFIGGGAYYGNGDSVADAKSFFINTAKAAEPTGYGTFQYYNGKVHIENSRFENSEYSPVTADSYFNEDNKSDFIEIVNSNFESNSQNLAASSSLRCAPEVTFCDSKFLLKNNWYGDSLGPNTPSSTISDGMELQGNYTLDGWRTNNLIVNPVVIVPGIVGSAQFLGEWQLDPITHTYDDLVSSLEKNGFTKDINLFDFPYQWRDNNETSARYLQSRIEGIINTTKVSKVDVVAHSMGGLVTRAYIEDITGCEYKNTIGKLIALGTPQKGSPESYLKWEAGEGFFTLNEKLLEYHFTQEAEHEGYDDLGKYIQEKIPSVKQLLPIYDYLSDASTGIMRNYPENYPRNTFLKELNSEINLEKLKKVDYTNIIGNLENDNSTISKIRVVESEVEGKWADGMPENFYNSRTDQGLENSNGDETVPLESAKGILSNKEIEVKVSHQDLPDKAQCKVFEELTGKTECEFVDNWHMTNILLFNVFSPVDIQIISPTNKKYGKDFENNKNFESIDGSFYTGFETKNEFITIPNPEDGEYKVLTQGTGDGGEYRIEMVNLSQGKSDEALESTVEIKGSSISDKIEELKVEVSGGKIIEKKQDEAPPVTEISITGAQGNNDWYTSDAKLTLSAADNENGSGVAKTEYSLDDEKNWTTYENPIAFTQEGLFNVSYRSIDKEDNIEEAKKVAIKIDKTAPEGKMAFNATTQKLDVLGTDNLSQNVSVEIKEQTVFIDNHQNEGKGKSWAWGWFQKEKTKEKKTVVTATLIDQAGHKTEIAWEKKKDKDRRIDIAIFSISYDGQKTDIEKGILQYKWMQDWRRKKYVLFVSHLSTNQMSIESHYFPNKNQTWIMEKPSEIADDDKDDNAEKRPVRKKLPGMVIPTLATEQGRIKISY